MDTVKVEPDANEEIEEVTVKAEPQDDLNETHPETGFWWCDVTKQDCTFADSSSTEPQINVKGSTENEKPKEEVSEDHHEMPPVRTLGKCVQNRRNRRKKCR
ncbi:uncharacterized protein [Periplaneta americana]|uniref:uncharacterized protein isoform X16 n=1 Tax=Periplaneta americana TaxID=6978 RepID=UPI0037E9918C